VDSRSTGGTGNARSLAILNFTRPRRWCHDRGMHDFALGSLDLKKLFRDPDMFDSAEDWRDAGFEILRSSENKICVASHDDVPDYLFKKYVNVGKRESPKDQLENYQSRVEGARRVRALIEEEDLEHVTVPGKWLLELPPIFGSRRRPAHILVVDRLDLMDDGETEREYRRIDEDVLRDLCVVLHAFRGLDSTAKNLPFTTDGRIALIDTEHWDRHSEKRRKQRAFLKYIGEQLSSDRRRFARSMWNELESARDDERDDDFDDEDDTSSDSSS
jgi:hypothetical protein